MCHRCLSSPSSWPALHKQVQPCSSCWAQLETLHMWKWAGIVQHRASSAALEASAPLSCPAAPDPARMVVGTGAAQPRDATESLGRSISFSHCFPPTGLPFCALFSCLGELALCCLWVLPPVQSRRASVPSRAGGAHFPPSPACSTVQLVTNSCLPFHSAWDRVFQDVGWAAEFSRCFVCNLELMNHIPMAQLKLGKAQQSW